MEVLENRASTSIHYYNKKIEPKLMRTSMADNRQPDKTRNRLIGATRNTASCKKHNTCMAYLPTIVPNITMANGVLSKSREQIHPLLQQTTGQDPKWAHMRNT
jgi:hypothetical protein